MSLCSYSLSFGLSSGERPSEYTEVPLGALDIAAADSLTLSPHHGTFMTCRCELVENIIFSVIIVV